MTSGGLILSDNSLHPIQEDGPETRMDNKDNILVSNPTSSRLRQSLFRLNYFPGNYSSKIVVQGNGIIHCPVKSSHSFVFF